MKNWLKFLAITLSLLAVAMCFGPKVRAQSTASTIYINCVNYSCSPDIGVGINAAEASLPTQGGTIVLPTGAYNQSTGISITKPTKLECQAQPVPTTVTYTPATGDAITVNTGGTSFGLTGCKFFTSTSTSSVGLLIEHAVGVYMDHFWFSGFSGGVRVTGDGVSLISVNVHMTDFQIDQFCGSGSYGISLDHTGDFYARGIEIYSATDCATSRPLVIDTDATGLYFSDGTLEQGLHAAVVQNSGLGGAWGGSPAAIFMSSITPDTTPGGSAFLFDSSLGGSDIKFFGSDIWAAKAGFSNSGIVTPNSSGIDIEGGSNIHFTGGTARGNSGPGITINSTGTNFSVENMQVLGNNQSNTAGVGGIVVTANPTQVVLTGNRSGDVVETGGNQYYGLDVSSATTGANAPYFCANNFANNITNQIKFPSGFALATNNGAYCGSLLGTYIPGFSRAAQQIADQGSACTNGELALSAGWGTSPTVTAVAGTGQTCEWTITSGTGTPTANPTITDTLTNALPSAATVCRASLIATASPAITPVDQTALSATAPVFTAYLTPGTGTAYKFSRTCGP